MPAVLGRPVPSRRKRVTLICTVCGREYEQHAYRAATSKFCSKACWGHRAPRAACETCGVIFAAHRDKGVGRFCSRECAAKMMVGPLAGAWKDGLSLERERARFSSRLTAWRKAVYRRDDFACQHCGARGVVLHAHHIEGWATHEALRFRVDNGITLCVPCHSAVHGRQLARA